MPRRNVDAPLERTSYEHKMIERLKHRGLLGLLREVSKELHVAMFEVVSRTRRKTPTKARHEIWRRLYDDHEFSFPEIASLFDRDHTTVMVGVRNARIRYREKIEKANGEDT